MDQMICSNRSSDLISHRSEDLSLLDIRSGFSSVLPIQYRKKRDKKNPPVRAYYAFSTHFFHHQYPFSFLILSWIMRRGILFWVHDDTHSYSYRNIEVRDSHHDPLNHSSLSLMMDGICII